MSLFLPCCITTGVFKDYKISKCYFILLCIITEKPTSREMLREIFTVTSICYLEVAPLFEML
jgi:hypothetical protein